MQSVRNSSMINVLFFAHLSELANTHSLALQLTEPKTVEVLLDDLNAYVPTTLIDQLKEQTAMVSINQRYATWQSVVNDGDELAFLPPVSGG